MQQTIEGRFPPRVLDLAKKRAEDQWYGQDIDNNNRKRSVTIIADNV